MTAWQSFCCGTAAAAGAAWSCMTAWQSFCCFNAPNAAVNGQATVLALAELRLLASNRCSAHHISAEAAADGPMLPVAVETKHAVQNTQHNDTLQQRYVHSGRSGQQLRQKWHCYC
jgi:hypothetical protein